MTPRWPIVVVMAVIAASGWFAPDQAAAQRAPKFWISNFEGERFDSRKHDGVAVVSFFFVDCVPCIKEIPDLHALVSGEFPEVALLFIDPIAEDTPQRIRAFAKRLGVPIRYFYHDPLGRLAKKFFKGQFVFPTIVGMREREILFRVTGLSPDSLDKIEAALR